MLQRIPLRKLSLSRSLRPKKPSTSLSRMHAIIVSIIATVFLVIIREICMVIYRLFFHPLAGIPGPKLASATQWYEFYYDVVKWPGGQYWLEVDKMHDRYGPIIRVTPYEVHIKDPDWFDILYCAPGQGARDKYPPSAHMTGTPLGTFGTVDHRIHQMRRSAISHFFSKRAIASIEPWIHTKTSKLLANMLHQQQHDGSVELRVNFLAMTTDMIATHTLNESNPQNTLHLLDDEEKAKEWQRTIAALAMLTSLVKQAPWLITVALKLPVGVWMGVVPSLGRIVKLMRDMRQAAQSAIDEEPASLQVAEGSKEEEFLLPIIDHHNIFHTVLKSSLPPSEKTSKRLGQEGVVAIAAGGETCARMMTNAFYYILANKERVMPPLMAELKSVMPTPDVVPELRSLEQLPYLTATIRETLRLTAILTSRLPLCAPFQTLQYRNHFIPPGHPISMSLRHILLNEAIFPSPLEFIPERWLPGDPNLERSKRFYVPFSRGTRGCVGINLAYAQLYITVATLLRRSEFSLHNVVYERDLKIVRDCFIGETELDSQGVCVQMKVREREVEVEV